MRRQAMELSGCAVIVRIKKQIHICMIEVLKKSIKKYFRGRNGKAQGVNSKVES